MRNLLQARYHKHMLTGSKRLNWTHTPLQVLARWPLDRPMLMLHSGRTQTRWSRWSILATPVHLYHFDANENTKTNTPENTIDPINKLPVAHHPINEMRQVVNAHDDGLWLGYLSYDLGRWIEKLPHHAHNDRHWPIACFGYCPNYLLHDTLTNQWHACGKWASNPPTLLDQPIKEPYQCTNLKSVFDQASYEQAVAKCIDYIYAGDIFQVNLSQRFTTKIKGKTPTVFRQLFQHLATISPAWYGAYMEFLLPHYQNTLLSTSPELFLELTSDGHITTRPIKGTRPAQVDVNELLRSEKDQAELHMIVDLMRNDLGRVCNYGSIRVTQPREIETHPTVHHGVATIEGKLKQTHDVFDLLEATMPGGSITGAPKIRAMEIIDELEPVCRGPYCGAIGYLSKNHGACFNIAIRTLLAETQQNTANGVIDFSVGGGIVADSTPHGEYQETLDKAAALLQALNLKI